MISTKQFSNPGVNPFTLDITPTLGQGIPEPQFSLGTVTQGDFEAEYVYCKLVLGGSTTLADGQAYTFDRDYVASLLSTSNSPRGQSVGFGRVIGTFAAGTYYIWLQRAGHVPAVATGSGNALAETTATAGTVNFTNTPTVSSKAIVGLYLFQTNFTFTANTTNGSAVLTAPSDTSNLAVGAAVAGTGIPGSTTVLSINKDGTVTLSANATATGSAVTMTVTGVLPANAQWPYIDKTN